MRLRDFRVIATALLCAAGAVSVGHAAQPIPEGVAATQAAVVGGTRSAESLTRYYLDVISQLDHAPTGYQLHSVIALNPNALADSRQLDVERKAGHVRGPLHGVPILIKDNIESADGTATTAGSLALANNVTGRDAPVVARLRAAGAVILGKTNLSEWANIRSIHSTSGWSAVGGLVKNPYVLDRSACGSSSGTGAAIAAGLAVVGVGTETDGSVTCPSSMNGLVGLKPTVGLVSRTHIVPISASQDTAGPMGRSVADVAALLSVMAGSDPADPATAEADARKVDYTAALAGASLKGVRLGVLRYALEDVGPDVRAVFARTLDALRAQGAEIIEVADFRPPEGFGDREGLVLWTELKAGLNAYLASTDPAKVKTRTLADVIAFDGATARETALFGQDVFEKAQATKGLSDPAYIKARDDNQRASREGIDRLLAEGKLDALIAPTTTPAWRTDVVLGDHDVSEGATSLAAVAGYPHLTVPMGEVRGLPVGLSFIGGKWREPQLLRLGAAFEAATHARRPPAFLATAETGPALDPVGGGRP